MREIEKARGYKACLVCGRDFSNRKSLSSRNDWEKVKYCSTGCSKKAK